MNDEKETSSMSKKKLWIIIGSSIAALVIVAVTLILVFTLGSKGKTEDGFLDSARSIKVVEIEGSATLEDEDESIPCFKGMNLYSGDKVTVNQKSVLVVRFDEDKYVYLGENTKINIKSEGKDRYKTNIFVEEGIVLAEVQNKLHEDEEFFLSSNNSVMAVRGTVFGLNVIRGENEIIETYSVYKGVTELVVFDKKDGEIIQGKISDLSDSKIEIKVPKNDVIPEEEFNNLTKDWLALIHEKFENPEDANNQLNEVEIVASKPSKEDYSDVIDVISPDTNVTYSSIIYNAEGYFGQYDGKNHKINVTVENPNAKITYKGENDNEYKDVNDYEFMAPGSYRVYYRIECEGFEVKEDFKVIHISKAKLNIEYTKDFVCPNLLIEGMSVEDAMDKINLHEYVAINGIDVDQTILKDSTFTYEGILSEEQDTYKAYIELPDMVKNYYDEAHIDLNLKAQKLVLDSTLNIEHNNGTPTLAIGNARLNKYNGILVSDLMAEAKFTIGGQDIEYNTVTYSYNYRTDGFYELENGRNTIDLEMNINDHIVNTTVFFYFFDQRYQSELNIKLDTAIVKELSNDMYWFKTDNLPSTENDITISGSFLLEKLGLMDCYINLPTDYLDDTSENYTKNNNFTFPKDQFSNINFTLMPTGQTKGANLSINVYFSQNEPNGYPNYTISNLSFRPNQEINFVVSLEPVTYSLDGINYSPSLSIPNTGKYDVYYRVGNSLIVEGKEYVTIQNSTITNDNLDLISNEIYVLTDEVHKYSMMVSNGETEILAKVESFDGSIMSPFKDIYEIYTNILKNSTYYDSTTGEEIECVVSVSEFDSKNPDFSYSIAKEGYDTISNTIHFIEAPITGLIESGQNAGGSTISNPQDFMVSLSDIDEVYATTPSISRENEFTSYSIIYSIDEGKTWTKEEPIFTSVGEYKVYSIYTYTVSGSGNENVLLSIQNIKVVE